jgi:hypothetical protein
MELTSKPDIEGMQPYLLKNSSKNYSLFLLVGFGGCVESCIDLSRCPFIGHHPLYLSGA